MCLNSTLPAVAQPVLTQIDDALRHLEECRMEHFKAAHRKYSPNRETPYVGFEGLVTCELYCRLKEKLGDIVFAEFPARDRKKIDLWLDSANCPVYLELKMYATDVQAACENDFHKLKKMVDAEPGTIAVQIHFRFYTDRDQTAGHTLQNLSGGLPAGEYWSDVVRDPQLRHFVRMAFGRK